MAPSVGPPPPPVRTRPASPGVTRTKTATTTRQSNEVAGPSARTVNAVKRPQSAHPSISENAKAGTQRASKPATRPLSAGRTRPAPPRPPSPQPRLSSSVRRVASEEEKSVSQLGTNRPQLHLNPKILPKWPPVTAARHILHVIHTKQRNTCFSNVSLANSPRRRGIVPLRRRTQPPRAPILALPGRLQRDHDSTRAQHTSGTAAVRPAGCDTSVTP
eukprot:6162437-Pyramimonas_sp.AAC.1